MTDSSLRCYNCNKIVVNDKTSGKLACDKCEAELNLFNLLIWNNGFKAGQKYEKEQKPGANRLRS